MQSSLILLKERLLELKLNNKMFSVYMRDYKTMIQEINFGGDTFSQANGARNQQN
jgi:hypothetical protein